MTFQAHLPILTISAVADSCMNNHYALIFWSTTTTVSHFMSYYIIPRLKQRFLYFDVFTKDHTPNAYKKRLLSSSHSILLFDGLHLRQISTSTIVNVPFPIMWIRLTHVLVLLVIQIMYHCIPTRIVVILDSCKEIKSLWWITYNLAWM